MHGVEHVCAHAAAMSRASTPAAPAWRSGACWRYWVPPADLPTLRSPTAQCRWFGIPDSTSAEDNQCRQAVEHRVMCSFSTQQSRSWTAMTCSVTETM